MTVKCDNSEEHKEKWRTNRSLAKLQHTKKRDQRKYGRPSTSVNIDMLLLHLLPLPRGYKHFTIALHNSKVGATK
jgi:hypothetical protein